MTLGGNYLLQNTLEGATSLEFVAHFPVHSLLASQQRLKLSENKSMNLSKLKILFSDL